MVSDAPLCEPKEGLTTAWPAPLVRYHLNWAVFSRYIPVPKSYKTYQNTFGFRLATRILGSECASIWWVMLTTLVAHSHVCPPASRSLVYGHCLLHTKPLPAILKHTQGSQNLLPGPVSRTLDRTPGAQNFVITVLQFPPSHLPP
jgi:hypothetical protein